MASAGRRPMKPRKAMKEKNRVIEETGKNIKVEESKKNKRKKK